MKQRAHIDKKSNTYDNFKLDAVWFIIEIRHLSSINKRLIERQKFMNNKIPNKFIHGFQVPGGEDGSHFNFHDH